MAFLSPQKIIEELGITPGMLVVDFGAGSGHFSIEAAKKLRGEGRVYAVDVQKQALEATRARAKAEHILNVETIWADLEAPAASKIRSGSADVVIVSNILFQLEEKEKLAEEAWRILKPGGRAAVIDWKEKVSKKEAEEIFLRAGFSKEKELYNVGDKHYGILFMKHKA